jgi:hypothetical protein
VNSNLQSSTERFVQYVAPEPGITACGAGIAVTLDGFGAFKLLASQYLQEEGIGHIGPDGELQVEYEQWYDLQAYLNAFRRISRELSETIIEQAGKAVPNRAHFPPHVNDIQSALRSIDVAYHMNHKKRGMLMYDPVNGGMMEGIGHYRYSKNPLRREITLVCDNPYPCALDRGLITAMAKRFEAQSMVRHDDGKPCRRRGGSSCTFLVTW